MYEGINWLLYWVMISLNVIGVVKNIGIVNFNSCIYNLYVRFLKYVIR